MSENKTTPETLSDLVLRFGYVETQWNEMKKGLSTVKAESGQMKTELAQLKAENGQMKTELAQLTDLCEFLQKNMLPLCTRSECEVLKPMKLLHIAALCSSDTCGQMKSITYDLEGQTVATYTSQ